MMNMMSMGGIPPMGGIGGMPPMGGMPGMGMGGMPGMGMGMPMSGQFSTAPQGRM